MDSTTRGAFNNARMLACDDVEAIGWPKILDARRAMVRSDSG